LSLEFRFKRRVAEIFHYKIKYIIPFCSLNLRRNQPDKESLTFNIIQYEEWFLKIHGLGKMNFFLYEKVQKNTICSVCNIFTAFTWKKNNL